MAGAASQPQFLETNSEAETSAAGEALARIRLETLRQPRDTIFFGGY